MAKTLYQLGLDALIDCGEQVTSLNPYFTPRFQYPALNDGKDEALAEVLQTFERYRTLIHTADTPTDFNVTGQEPEVGDLPPNFIRIAFAQVLEQDRYSTIEEGKPGEAHAGFQFPSPASALSARITKYFVLGRKLFIDPPSPSAVTAGVRVYMEKDIPDLLVGKPAGNSGAADLKLAAVADATIGQEKAEPTDDLYNGIEVEIVSGTGVGERVRITDYTGASRTATVTPAWAAPPTTGSVYSMVMPVPRPFERVARLYAALKMMLNAKEDASHVIAMYESARTQWGAIYDQQTPGSREAEPVEVDDW